MTIPTQAAIAANSRATADAGARVARLGGNAVDVAVAAALAATVSEILMCSLGGSAFVMLHLPGKKPELIDGADAMPGIGKPRDPGPPRWRQIHVPYGDGLDFMAGHGAVAVPGALAALELAWKRHGSLPWSEILAPAIDIARSGWPAPPAAAAWLDITGPLFGHQRASRQSFYQHDSPVRAGQIMRIPGLADSMEAVSRHGASALYQGDLAHAFAREMHDHGGYVTRDDLAAYRAVVRSPLMLASRGFSLALNPPPAVGGAAAGSLIGLLDATWDQSHSPAQRALCHARAQACLVRLRSSKFNSRDFDDAAARALLEPDTLRRHARSLRSPHTTHLSVTTADGGAVAISMSIGYGAGVTIPGTGIACNNSLGETELNPFGFFAVPPGTRLVSNMAPTVAWHADGRCIALGSPGASRITTAVAQTWARYAFEQTSLEQAVAGPRLHVEEWEDGLRVQCEPGIDTSLLDAEFIVRPFDRLNMFFGGTHLAGLDGQGDGKDDAQKRLHAVADLRRQGVTAVV